MNVPGTERDQDRGGRGFSREAGEEEGYSFREERLERWGLEVSRVCIRDCGAQSAGVIVPLRP